ncbi:MAG: large-conductance mechanosensitive channel protein MscL [Duncaniella sp.]|nr:large-conductance mechanosensitive channel protein MscL [Duncaniella sp.]
MSLLKEFKDFAMRGNVIDMAVGVVIGAAFGKIVSSLVDDLIMPLVGVATGGINFTDYKWVIQKAVMDGTEIIKPEVTLNWGTWIQTIVNFLIVAFCIFLAIKVMNRFRKQEAAAAEEAAAAPAEPTKEEVLLTEIRDLLKKQAAADGAAK